MSETIKPHLFILHKQNSTAPKPEIAENYEEFMKYLENLNYKLKTVLSRQKTLVHGKYLSSLQYLEKTRKSLAAYEEKMKKLQKEIDENDLIKTLMDQIMNFKSYYDQIMEKLHFLNSEIVGKEEATSLLMKEFAEKKGLLMSVHQENVGISTKILNYKNILKKEELGGGREEKKGDFNHNTLRNLTTFHTEESINNVQQSVHNKNHNNSGHHENKNKSITNNRNSNNSRYNWNITNNNEYNNTNYSGHNPNSNQIKNEANINTYMKLRNFEDRTVLDQNDYQKIEAELLLYRKKLQSSERKKIFLKNQITFQANKYFSLRNLFSQAFFVSNQNLIKNQEITNDEGLKNSLLFKIKKIETFYQDGERFGEKKGVSSLQDRELKNVVYGALKSVVEKNKKNKKNEGGFEGINLDWDDFKKMGSAQIMGLLSMKPEFFGEINMELDKKNKKINKLLLCLKQTS